MLQLDLVSSHIALLLSRRGGQLLKLRQHTALDSDHVCHAFGHHAREFMQPCVSIEFKRIKFCTVPLMRARQHT